MADITNPQDELKTQITDDQEIVDDNAQITDDPGDDDPKESSIINALRKKQRADAKRAAELQAQLDKINKEKSDKDKTLEEKLAALEAEREADKKSMSEYKKRSQVEKALILSGVDSKVAELLIDKAVERVDEDGENLSDVLEELKTEYSTLFLEKPKPIGKVGISAVGSSKSNKLTKEEVLKLISDPNTPLSDELDKLAREYGI